LAILGTSNVAFNSVKQLYRKGYNLTSRRGAVKPVVQPSCGWRDRDEVGLVDPRVWYFP
jgi:hypothetical protein